MNFSSVILILSLSLGIFAIGIQPYADAFEDSVVVGEFPRDIEIDYGLRNLYIPNFESGTISVIDSENFIPKDLIILKDANPTKITVDSNRHVIFVTDKISGELTIIDGINGKLISKLNLGDSLWDLDINQQNGKLYVLDTLNNNVIIFDTERLEIINTVKISSSPWAVKVNENTNLVYVASGTSEKIDVIDGDTNEIVNNIHPEMKSWGISINKNTNTLYSTSWDSNFVSKVDLNSNKLLEKISIPTGVWQIETNPVNGITIISNEHTNELYLIDEKSAKTQTITLNNSPQAISTSIYSNTIYVTNPIANTISAINYEHSLDLTDLNNEILGENSEYNELVFEVAKGITEIPNREFDTDLISGLLQNIGVTGELNGNEIARLLIEDYMEKKNFEPKSAQVPVWAVDLAMMYTNNDEGHEIPQKVDCSETNFVPFKDIENPNPFEIWLNILPICALS
ncbi:YncE family protein [Nitrosopumilus sp.]|uniref:YncE family protein n=1 Tax=Nitrosopumilus sp. TaxID=2024843 RepID=UPI00260EB29F|nr:YncE family protein [Nitrosopumilus sp.]